MRRSLPRRPLCARISTCGNALQRLGRINEAIAALEAALRIDPASAPCRFNLGNVHVAAGDFAAAEREFEAALALDPAMADAAIALANALESQQRPLEAEQQLRGLLATTPDCAPAAYNLGLLLLARDEFDSAEAMFRACLEADPKFLAAYTALGNLIRNAGRSRDAEHWYRQALAIDPLAQEAWSAMLLSFNNRDDLSAQDVLAEHLRFGAAFPPRATASTPAMARIAGTRAPGYAWVTCRAISSSIRSRCSCVRSSCITIARDSKCSAIPTMPGKTA